MWYFLIFLAVYSPFCFADFSVDNPACKHLIELPAICEWPAPYLRREIKECRIYEDKPRSFGESLLITLEIVGNQDVAQVERLRAARCAGWIIYAVDTLKTQAEPAHRLVSFQEIIVGESLKLRTPLSKIFEIAVTKSINGTNACKLTSNDSKQIKNLIDNVIERFSIDLRKSTNNRLSYMVRRRLHWAALSRTRIELVLCDVEER